MEVSVSVHWRAAAAVSAVDGMRSSGGVVPALVGEERRRCDSRHSGAFGITSPRGAWGGGAVRCRSLGAVAVAWGLIHETSLSHSLGSLVATLMSFAEGFATFAAAPWLCL